jgi:hypothetical protein
LNDATAWAGEHLTAPLDIDCTTAVMLKILDGKCKMAEEEKAVMEVLYDAVKSRAGKFLGSGDHTLIARARQVKDDSLVMEIYERRLMAETMISRPVMKAYKARLWDAGILGGADQAG